ncbi:MAG TPA: alpha-amlyase, partial [Bacteroidaceae bacterium]|nr:alpha-amlyase [Bacteroidaceae bacterium]
PGLVSYWQKGKQNRDGYRGNLPGLMDFPLQNALKESLLAEDGWDSGWMKLYETLASDYEYPDPFNLVVFPDNHDMSRFYVQMDKNEKLYRLGIIYILTTRGIPQILYGSEILMTHPKSAHHGDIRKDFPGGWPGDSVNAFTGEGLSEKQKAMQAFFKKLLFFRMNHPVLHDGKLIHYAPEKGTYVYGRFNDQETIMVILNKSVDPMNLNMERFTELVGDHRTGTDIITGQPLNLAKSIEIPGLTGYILELQ